MSKNSNMFFRTLLWIFIAGVVGQVLLAGLTVVAGRLNWDYHITLGHILALPLILMLITMYVAKADRKLKNITWILFVTYVFQADVLIFLRTNNPPLSYLSALHPVLALIDFWLAMRLLDHTKGAV
jgi:hypothetical protein